MKQMSNLNYAMFLLWYSPQLVAIILLAIITLPIAYMTWLVNPLAGINIVNSFETMVREKTEEVRKTKERLKK